MLLDTKLKQLHTLVESATKEEIIWINGFLAGVVFKESPKVKETVSLESNPKRVTIAFGTETGNSKKIALDFASNLKTGGDIIKVTGLDQYRFSDLTREEFFIVIISTHGDGEPPESARKFFDELNHFQGNLSKLKYGVLALGDSSYPLFCQAGEDLDNQLNRLGATRFVDLHKSNVDYEETANSFLEVLKKSLGKQKPQQSNVAAEKVKDSGRKISKGRILTNINLNDIGSNKQTHHIEFESDAAYEPGDSVAIVPMNPSSLVNAIINLVGIDGDLSINFRNENGSIKDLLTRKINLSYLPQRVVEKYASVTGQDIPKIRIDLLDLLKIYPIKSKEQFIDVVSILEPIAPRMYSISSSSKSTPSEVHITVVKDVFKVNQDVRHGLCSNYLLNLSNDETLEFYVQKNGLFKLPEPDRDIIMIGPGTGIAPFRSFLAERDALGASGRNWLFFGEQHFTTDFLYQTELLNWKETGLITRLDVAFSRDQVEKIYVQHKIEENGEEFFKWLDQGAVVYLCGKKDPMSYDVENSIVKVIATYSNRSRIQAAEYLERVKQEGRFLKDVY